MPACGIFYEGYLAGSAKLWYTTARPDAPGVLPAHTCFNTSILASQSGASFQSLSSSTRHTNGKHPAANQGCEATSSPPGHPRNTPWAPLAGIPTNCSRHENACFAELKCIRIFSPPFWKWIPPQLPPLCKIALGEGNRANSACSPCGLTGNCPTRNGECSTNTDTQVKRLARPSLQVWATLCGLFAWMCLFVLQWSQMLRAVSFLLFCLPKVKFAGEPNGFSQQPCDPHMSRFYFTLV